MLTSRPKSAARGATVAYVLSVSFELASQGAAKMSPKSNSDSLPKSWRVSRMAIGGESTHRSYELGPFLSLLAQAVWELPLRRPTASWRSSSTRRTAGGRPSAWRTLESVKSVASLSNVPRPSHHGAAQGIGPLKLVRRESLLGVPDEDDAIRYRGHGGFQSHRLLESNSAAGQNQDSQPQGSGMNAREHGWSLLCIIAGRTGRRCYKESRKLRTVPQPQLDHRPTR